jgi:hypothetical protein
MVKKVQFILITIFLFTGCIFSIPIGLERLEDFSITTARIKTNRNTNLIADEQIVYYLSGYGLESYVMTGAGEVILADRLHLTDPWTMNKVDDNIFVGTYPIHGLTNAIIYKINVSNPYNLIIEQILELDDNITAVLIIHIVNDHLLLHTFSYPERFPLLNTDLETVIEEPISAPPTLVFGNDLVLSCSEGGDGLIYDFSDLDNIMQVGSGSIEEGHQYGVLNEYTYQDSILIFYNESEISFWDVSQPDDWQMLYNIIIEDSSFMITGEGLQIIEDTLVYLNHDSLIAIDLNDYSYSQMLENPIQESYQYCVGIGYAYSGNDLFVSTSEYGIQRFAYEDEFAFVETIGDEKYNDYIQMSGHYMFVGSGNLCNEGIVVYDTSNPYNITEVNRLMYDPPLFFIIIDGLLCMYRFPWIEYREITIYDITNPVNPELRSTLDLSPWSQPHVYFINSQTEQNFIYVTLREPARLLKFDIATTGESELLFDISIPDGSIVIDDDLMYILSRSGNSYWYDLHIYEGLENNYPILSNIIDYFVGQPDKYLKIVGDYLAVYDSFSGEGNTSFYSLSEPFSPVLKFEIGKSGIPYLKDNLLFLTHRSVIYIYDAGNDPSGTLTPISYILNNNWYQRNLFFQDLEGKNYLYCASTFYIAVYEYSYETGIEDDIAIPVEETYLSRNYPNPFNPETNISFYLEQEKRVKLEIFNIRGQKLAVLIDVILPEGEHSVVWSPQNHRGRDLPSGVYLYRLKAGDYDKTRKMLYLK